MGKRQQEAAETREKLLRAAAQLSENGSFRHVLVEDITKRAGVSKGTFYTYYRRREDIVSELAFRKLEEVCREVDSQRLPLAEHIEEFLLRSMRIIEAGGLETAQEWMSSAMMPVGAQSIGPHKLRFDREYLLRCLQAAKSAGECRSDAPVEEICSLILAQYYGIVACWCITDGETSGLEAMRRYCCSTLPKMLAPCFMDD